MSNEQEDLFDVLMLDSTELSVVVVTSNYDSDYAFAYFEEFVREEDITEMSQEDIMGHVMDYTDALLPPHLKSTDSYTPMVTRMILTESSVVLAVALEPELISYIDETYPDSDSISAVFEDDSSEEPEGEEDEPEDDWEV